MTSKAAKMAIACMYISGWISLMTGITLVTATPIRRALVMVCCLASAVALFSLRGNLADGRGVAATWRFLALAVSMLGLAAVDGLDNKHYWLPFVSALVFLLGIAIVPWQHRVRIVGGPAVPLITLALLMMAISKHPWLGGCPPGPDKGAPPPGDAAGFLLARDAYARPSAPANSDAAENL
eukprot:jgi/Tetstr1/453989/TSEL_040908.t1